MLLETLQNRWERQLPLVVDIAATKDSTVRDNSKSDKWTFHLREELFVWVVILSDLEKKIRCEVVKDVVIYSIDGKSYLFLA